MAAVAQSVATPARNARRVLENWGGDAPEWVWALAGACDRTSQTAVGRALGHSSSLVSGVLGNRYSGDIATFEQKVRGHLMHETVPCPIAGDINRDVCIGHQERAREGRFATSSMRMRFNRMCPKCINRVSGGVNGGSE